MQRRPKVLAVLFALLLGVTLSSPARAGRTAPADSARIGMAAKPIDLLPDPTRHALRSVQPDCCGGWDCWVPLSLTGQVTDPTTHLPVVGARVTVGDYSQVTSVLTDGSGHYATPELYGYFNVIVEAGSYRNKAQLLSIGCYDYCCWGACSSAPPITLDVELSRDPCGTWNSTASDPIPRAAASAATISSTVYVLGGANATGYLATNSAFDATAKSWSSRAAMPAGRAGSASGVLNGSIYVAGGLNAGGAVAVTHRYNPMGDSWTSVAPMPHEGWGVAGVTLGGKLWVLGGYSDAEGEMPWLRAYDPGSDSWTMYPEMANGRSWHAAAVLDGKIFAIGGTSHYYPPNATASVEIFDPNTNSWTWGPELPQVMKDVSAVTDAANSRILVIGGTTGDGAAGTEIAYRTILQLKAAAGGSGYEWTYLNAYPTSGAGTAAALANGQLYGFGGRSAYPSTYSQLTWYMAPPPIPSAPANTRAEIAQDNTAITIRWNAVSGATGYRVQRTGGGDSRTWTVTTTSCRDADVAESVTYAYSVAAMNACGAFGPGSTVSPTIHYPVIFVHGICGDPSGWADWGSVFRANGLTDLHSVDLRRREADGTPKLESANRPIDVSAQLLQTFVASIPGKVNIVAHSMGGIVARQYIQVHGGAAKLNKLVMLGSPNHGAGFKRIAPTMFGYVAGMFSGFLHCLVLGEADDQLQVNSEFLRELNYGRAHGIKDKQCPDDRAGNGVELASSYADRCWTISGTGSQTGLNCQSIYKRSETWQCSAVNKTSDGFISVGSVRLDALSSDPSHPCDWQVNHNLIDFDLIGKHVYHTDLAGAFCDEGYLGNSDLAVQVVRLLKNEPFDQAHCPALLAQDAVSPASAQTALDSLDAVDLPYLAFAQPAGTVFESPMVLPSTPEASFFCLNSQPGGIGFRLRTPSGSVIAPTDTAGRTDLLYRDEIENGLQFFVIRNPIAGTWHLVTDAGAASDSQRVGLIGQIRSNNDLEAVMDTVDSGGASLLRVTGMPVQSGVLIAGAALQADVVTPQGVLETVPLLDDGAHGDGAAGDGVYAALLAPSGGSGLYGADVRGSWTAGSELVERAVSTSYGVTASIDLAVDSLGLTPSNATPDSGSYVTLTLKVRNLGSQDADSATVGWFAVGTGQLGQMVISVPARDSVTASIPWQAVGGDSIALFASVIVGPGDTETNYTNNVAWGSVVTGPSVVGVAAEPLPAAFQMSSPRPNPARGVLQIPFALPRPERVEAEVFDIAGRRVRTLVAGQFLGPGEHILSWDGRDNGGAPVANGVFLVRVRAGRESGVRRIVLLR